MAKGWNISFWVKNMEGQVFAKIFPQNNNNNKAFLGPLSVACGQKWGLIIHDLMLFYFPLCTPFVLSSTTVQ